MSDQEIGCETRRSDVRPGSLKRQANVNKRGGGTHLEAVPAGASRVAVVGHGEGDLVGARLCEGGEEGPSYVVPQSCVGGGGVLMRREG